MGFGLRTAIALSLCVHGGKALAYYSDRKIRLEGPGFTPKLLERPVVVDIRPKPPGPEPQPPVSSEPVVLQVRVVGEQGGTVRLAAPPDYLPGVGDKVEVFFVIAEPDNLGLIGTGKVTDVADDHLLAKLEQGTGKVTKDHQYLAKVYAARPRKRLRLDRFAGTWEIDDPDASFRLVLRAEGGKVTGIYGRAGQVDGEVKDGKLVLNWRRPDLKRGGSAELALSADAKLLEGTWQHDPKAFDNGLSGGGTWRFRHAAASTTPEPSSPGRDMVQVPAVVGLSAKEAVEAVRKARLLPKAEVHDPPPSQDKAFEVYRTAPAAGTLVARSSEVRLWVYARPDEPDEAEPKPRKPGGTDLSGKWQETSLVWGKSLWTLTAQADGRYRAQQHNLGKVSGTAELTGDMLRLDWKMKDGSHQGFYEWKLSADRASGKGKSVVTKGAVGTYASSIKRVGAGPATEDKDKDTKKP